MTSTSEQVFQVTLTMTETDFRAFIIQTRLWAHDSNWADEIADHRFQLLSCGPGQPFPRGGDPQRTVEEIDREIDEENELIDLAWNFAHWLDGESWATVVLARSFLEAQEESYQVLFDHDGPEGDSQKEFPNCYVLLTNYTPGKRLVE
ncbi:hypothetical protein MOQ72_27085 [Saccharopolyspora sp. K220]|uniref:hypothetical protein n=1 Tax=Saccharopolyspora soli TaxID=2926618 RepID=UPI001F58CD19|nr:hypothetical protein [Saccharopolyspora soli]MCI2421113.1 hypothetical protein [Saccharopolyspora soli]